jgi:curli biogenesis system outer membrane secretion channel CsgG
LGDLISVFLEFQLVSSGLFKVVDRKTLDAIRLEQNFQMSGDVDDNSAVSIGKMLGANIVITGTGSTQRLTLKALDVKTAEIVTMARESF